MSYELYDAVGLSTLVKTRQASPAELLHEASRRIEDLNPSLNAVPTLMKRQAWSELLAGPMPQGLLEGVPFLVQELGVAVAGTATSSSSGLFRRSVASFDSEIVARQRRGGLLILGKTSASEFGLSVHTESDLHGVARNPWALELSPGGAAGGSAAAVAAGMVPAAHAGDSWGGLRMAASCCGLFGLKPTRGRITCGPEAGEVMGGLDSQHAVTRSVRDSAALLDVTSGQSVGDPYFLNPPMESFLRQTQQPVTALRIAVADHAPDGKALDRECVRAVHSAARLCEQLGHEVQVDRPYWDPDQLRDDLATVVATNVMAGIARATGGSLSRSLPIGSLARVVAERGQRISGSWYVQALQSLHRQARRIAKFFQSYDVLLTPTLGAVPPPMLGVDEGAKAYEGWLDRLDRYACFTLPFNVTGQPAASVPLHWTPAGIPVGCQFVARHGEEALLLRLCAQLEGARPWFGRRPPLLRAVA